MGVYFYIYTGGEPLVRKNDLISLAFKHRDCVFMTFTNGTLIDEAFADDLLLIKSWVEEIKAASIYVGYEIYKKETGEVCVTGSSMHPVTDTELKPMRFKKVRPDLYEKFKRCMEDAEKPKKRLRKK